ncbi:MAG TPA: VOC family protein [Gammaproteobacteria bacterium]|jgi:lactoylglutathione lyase|nr:VOC family protein [Gammaproteobacteria bacterium]
MRILHTMLRVGDLERSIAFYTGVMGMRLLRRKEYPEGQFSLAYLGYGAEAENSVLAFVEDPDGYKIEFLEDPASVH